MDEHERLILAATRARTVPDLAEVLAQVRRIHRGPGGRRPATYRELSASTGLPHTTIGTYLSGKVLAPADRFDLIVSALGVPAELCRALATARDRVEDLRRGLGRSLSEPSAHENSEPLLDATAERSLRIAEAVSAGTAGDALDSLRAGIGRLAAAYGRQSSSAITRQLVDFHNAALDLTAARLSKKQAKRLYLYAGLSGYLLASAGHDQANWPLSARYAQAARLFVGKADDGGSAHALICNIQSLSGLLQGRDAAALRFALEGMDVTRPSRGTMPGLLALRAARALATRGRTAEAFCAVAHAERGRNKLIPDELDTLLGYDHDNTESAYFSYAAEVFAALPPERTVLTLLEEHARHAAQGYRDPHRAGWTFDRAALAHLLLAKVYAHRDDLDAVDRLTKPVLLLPPHQRIADLRHATASLRAALRTRPAGRQRDELLGRLAGF
ncbi:hypothetical protein ACFFRC_36935 [Amycolatopsis halotolerans]|uniref:hypothetical protein n=1 Tax=Amycolatopsis halotolerans TaxID=330083 RepID=UPI0035ECD814